MVRCAAASGQQHHMHNTHTYTHGSYLMGSLTSLIDIRQREVDKLDIFLQQSHDCHGCAMRCCPCGPALKEDSCCVPCRCYSAEITDTMTCFQTIPAVSCICLWLFSFPMWLCGNCCASCRYVTCLKELVLVLCPLVACDQGWHRAYAHCTVRMHMCTCSVRCSWWNPRVDLPDYICRFY
jgi:hypothetical protein